jgi:hypothetical protein
LVAAVQQGHRDKHPYLMPQVLEHLLDVLSLQEAVRVVMAVRLETVDLVVEQVQYLEAQMEVLEFQVKVTLAVLV